MEKNIGVILAAGLSSRMNDFKPLLKIGNKVMIQHTLDAFINAGINKIYIVVGHKKERIIKEIDEECVEFVVNKDYQTNDMMASIQLALSQIENCNKIIISPADIPLVNPETIQSLMNEEGQFIKPVYKNKSGHPIVIDGNLKDHILNYSGEDGLRGFLKLSQIQVTKVNVDDFGIIYDADTPSDYKRILSLYHNK